MAQEILSNIKIVDFGTMFAAPMAATFLAEFGADVIHVEHPSGDAAAIDVHRGDVLQLLKGLHPHFLLDLLPVLLHLVRGALVEEGAAVAHDDAAGNRPLLQHGGEEDALDAHGAGALTGDDDPVGVAAVGLDVPLDPLDGGDLVRQAEVALAAVSRHLIPGAQAVVDGDQDHAVLGVFLAVDPGIGPAAVHKGAAVDVEQDGAVFGVVRRPDIEVQRPLFAVVSGILLK